MVVVVVVVAAAAVWWGGSGSCSCLSIYPSNLSIHRSIYLSIYLSTYLSVCLSICKLENEAILRDFLTFWNLTSSKTQQFCETSSIFWLDNVKNAAILRDFLNLFTWRRQKRSNSARLPQFSKLTTSNTKQFCETSFENGKLSAELTASYQCVLRFLHSICLKYCACHQKSEARSYEVLQVLHLSHKIILPNLKIWCSKMQPFSGAQRPDLLTSLMNMSLVLRLPQKMHLSRSSSNVPRLPTLLKLLPATKPLTRCTLLTRCTIPCAFHAKRHLKVQKFSEHVVFLTFWLGNVLRATAACTFSTSQLPKVVRTWDTFYNLISKCASCRTTCNVFISHLVRRLRTL